MSAVEASVGTALPEAIRPGEGGLRGLWGRAWRPSLIRRLVLAQMVILGILWTVILFVAIWSARNGDGLLDSEPAFDAALAMAQDLDAHPDQQRNGLKALDRVLHGFWAGADSTELVPVLLVWKSGQLLYRSPGDVPTVRVEASAKIQHVSVQGRQWLARSRASADGQVLATLLIPDTYALIVTLSSRSFYLLPLIVSLPFLVLPAWLSVRIALRPWQRLSEEVASRRAGDLRPLTMLPVQRELRPLVLALNRLLAELSASSLRERNLIADAAHQLRTPLAALRVGVGALGRHQVPGELMANLVRTSERASRLVDQLLRLMRSEAAHEGPSQPVTNVDIDLLLRDRLAIFDALAHAKDVELEYDGTPEAWVQGEREDLEALIDNLVDNAIKYSPPGSVVNVVLTAPGDALRLEVLDRGPGIDEPWRERVFDRFFRAPDQAQSGSGLGLAIVRSAVTKHKGRVQLLNRGGGGLCVQVELPRANAWQIDGRP